MKAPAAATPLSPRQLFWKRLRARRSAMAGGVILAGLYLAALLAGFAEFARGRAGARVDRSAQHGF